MPPRWPARRSHEDLVRFLVGRGAARTDAVRAAIAAVDRADFLDPEARRHAYRDAPVLLKVDAETGEALSTMSQPSIVALMLEELAVALRPGGRVLEVGTASGYNAALLSHLVGDGGLVVTIELDDELAASAAGRLRGLGNVRVVAGDGRAGHAADAPYDGVIVTAGAEAVAPAWVEQLAVGGRLVVPITGANRIGSCVTYERTADGLVERSSMACGFVPLR